jgi:hypothetical protein
MDTYDIPKLNQEDIKNLNRAIKNNEIESKKSPGLDGLTNDFYQTFKEELMITLSN